MMNDNSTVENTVHYFPKDVREAWLNVEHHRKALTECRTYIGGLNIQVAEAHWQRTRFLADVNTEAGMQAWLALQREIMPGSDEMSDDEIVLSCSWRPQDYSAEEWSEESWVGC